MDSPDSDNHRTSLDEMGTLHLSSTSFHPLSPVPVTDDPLLSSPLQIPPASSSSPSPDSFLDPPSYSDVIFTPQNGSRSPCSQSRSGRVLTAIYSRITVGDPQKEQETTNLLVPGANTYVTYLITTRTASDDLEYNVRRRFRDVVMLADRLAESYKGFFVPTRPDKNVMESQVMQKQEFVEQRRVALEKYLWRLAAHPVIGRSEELRAFLMLQGNMQSVASVSTDMVRTPRRLFGEDGVGSVLSEVVVQPVKGGRDLMRMFRELRQSVVNDWGGVKPAVDEEDKEFLERKEKVQDLEQQLSTASQQAEALVKAQQDIGETMGELGLAFIKLTKFETEESVYDSQRRRASDARCFGTAAVKASRFYRELNSQTVKHLDKLHEYLGLMLSVHSAFSDRSSALLSVQTLLSELSSLRTKCEKLEAASSKVFGGDSSRIRKIEELKETIRTTENAKSVALAEYERIKENNSTELERLDSERREDFLCMLKAFVINQGGYAEKIASVWEKVVEDTNAYAEASD